MEANEMFEKATRMKLRFQYKGLCTVEDLWDLTPRNLDAVYKVLRAEQKKQDEDSLLDTKTADDRMVNLQVEIVKYIVGVKVAEEEARKTKAERAMQRNRIAEVIAQKKEESLLGMSVEELEKMQAAL